MNDRNRGKLCMDDDVKEVNDNKPDIKYDYNFPVNINTSYYSYEPSVEEVYVNIKQFEAIKKRKSRRDYLDSLMGIQKSSYLHESRHRHAMNRLRAPSGRFLTKDEMAKMKECKSKDVYKISDDFQ